MQAEFVSQPLHPPTPHAAQHSSAVSPANSSLAAMRSQFFLRWEEDGDIIQLLVFQASTKSVAKADFAAFNNVAFLLDLGMGLCRVERGTVVKAVGGTDESPPLAPGEAWISSNGASWDFTFVLVQGGARAESLSAGVRRADAVLARADTPTFPYYKDLMRGNVKPSAKNRSDFNDAAKTVMEVRTFMRCTLSGKGDAQYCHLIPATRGQVLEL